MKRIISACLEQTQKFETDGDYQTYIKGLERKRIKYKIVDKQVESDNTVIVKVKRDYSNYPVGDYLD
jgi:hypothetical protein